MFDPELQNKTLLLTKDSIPTINNVIENCYFQPASLKQDRAREYCIEMIFSEFWAHGIVQQSHVPSGSYGHDSCVAFVFTNS